MKIRLPFYSLLLLITLSLDSWASNDIAEQLMKGDAESEKLLQEIIKEADTKGAITLFVAAGAAMQHNDRVNAAYLFYIAKFRAQFDKTVFPPVGTGGDSPMVVFGALASQMGSAINPEIMRNPLEFEQAVTLTNKWSPKVPEDYDPGWDYSTKASVKVARKELMTIQQQFNIGMGNLVALLKIPDYYSSFIIVQDYNLKWDDERPSKEAYEQAKSSLIAIEKSKNVEGMFYKPEKK